MPVKPNIGSNLPFTTKYRCTEYDEIIGNEDNIAFLKALHEKEVFPPLIILYGYYGTSKTTCSNIITRTLLCKHPLPNGLACGSCSSCMTIDKYLIGLEEEDPNGNVNYRILDLGRYNDDDAYISKVTDNLKTSIYAQKKGPLVVKIEEMQKVSEASQPKFNKIFENLPPNVHVIINTNDLYSLPTAIVERSRVQLQFTVPSDKEMVKYVEKICKYEGISLKKDEMKKLVNNTNKNPRRILEALNAIKDTGSAGKNIVIREKFGYTDYIDFLKAMRLGSMPLLDFIDKLQSKIQFILGMHDFFRIANRIRNNGAVDISSEFRSSIMKEIQMVPPTVITRLMGSLVSLKMNRSITENDAESYIIAIASELNLSMVDNFNMSEKQAVIKSRQDVGSGAEVLGKDEASVELEELVQNMPESGDFSEDFLKQLEEKKASRVEKEKTEYNSPFDIENYTKGEVKKTKMDATLVTDIKDSLDTVKQGIINVNDL